MGLEVIEEIRNGLTDYEKYLENVKNLFINGMKNDEDRFENHRKYKVAYEQKYKYLKGEMDEDGKLKRDKNGNVENQHVLKKYIDNVYIEIDKIREKTNGINPTFDYLDKQLKLMFKYNIDNLKEYKTDYDKADRNFSMTNNLNSASQILKIDSYDRNIEENVFILYYLLSYGILGFFVYKLIKL